MWLVQVPFWLHWRKIDMEVKTLTCIRCPMGCLMSVHVENNKVVNVSGNTCKRGDTYAKKEVTDPVRTVTSTIKVSGGDIAQVSCKTSTDVKKDRVMDVMRALKGVKTTAPVSIGDVLIKDVAGTGVDIIATKDIKKINRK